MGLYIDPPSGTKEEWLTEHGELLSGVPNNVEYEDHMVVCLMQNPMFSAAGIVTDAREFQAFSDPRDLRPKLWYRVPREKVEEVQPLVKRN